MADSLSGGERAAPRPTNPALAAAPIGGATAGAAGAVWTARALAERNGARRAGELSPVMQTAITACELAHAAPDATARA